MDRIDDGPRGIGGWLIFFMIGQAIVVVTSVATINSGFAEMSASWEMGEQFGYLRPLLVVETVMHLAQIFVPLVGFALIARTSSSTPAYWRIYLVLVAIYALFDIAFSFRLLADLKPLVDAEAAREIETEIRKAVTMNVRAIVYSIVWSLYWTRSRRVRNTFATAGASVGLMETVPLDAGEQTGLPPVPTDRFQRPTHPCPSCGAMILVAADYCRYCRAPVGAPAAT